MIVEYGYFTPLWARRLTDGKKRSYYKGYKRDIVEIETSADNFSDIFDEVLFKNPPTDDFKNSLVILKINGEEVF